MPRKYKARLANNTIGALESILTQCINSREEWQKLINLAEKRMDPETILYLAKIRDRLAEIERLAKDARQGEYNPRNG